MWNFKRNTNIFQTFQKYEFDISSDLNGRDLSKILEAITQFKNMHKIFLNGNIKF